MMMSVFMNSDEIHNEGTSRRNQAKRLKEFTQELFHRNSEESTSCCNTEKALHPQVDPLKFEQELIEKEVGFLVLCLFDKKEGYSISVRQAAKVQLICFKKYADYKLLNSILYEDTVQEELYDGVIGYTDQLIYENEIFVQVRRYFDDHLVDTSFKLLTIPPRLIQRQVEKSIPFSSDTKEWHQKTESELIYRGAVQYPFASEESDATSIRTERNFSTTPSFYWYEKERSFRIPNEPTKISFALNQTLSTKPSMSLDRKYYCRSKHNGFDKVQEFMVHRLPGLKKHLKSILTKNSRETYKVKTETFHFYSIRILDGKKLASKSVVDVQMTFDKKKEKQQKEENTELGKNRKSINNIHKKFNISHKVLAEISSQIGTEKTQENIMVYRSLWFLDVEVCSQAYNHLNAADCIEFKMYHKSHLLDKQINTIVIFESDPPPSIDDMKNSLPPENRAENCPGHWLFKKKIEGLMRVYNMKTKSQHDQEDESDSSESSDADIDFGILEEMCSNESDEVPDKKAEKQKRDKTSTVGAIETKIEKKFSLTVKHKKVSDIHVNKGKATGETDSSAVGMDVKYAVASYMWKLKQDRSLKPESKTTRKTCSWERQMAMQKFLLDSDKDFNMEDSVSDQGGGSSEVTNETLDSSSSDIDEETDIKQ